MSIELWEEGVIVEFIDSKPCCRAIIRSVGKSEVIFSDLSSGSTIRASRVELDDIYKNGGTKFLAESRDFGELKFADLTEKEQKETNRKYKYIKRLVERDVTKITEKSSTLIIHEVATELGEKAPHWQSVRGWYKNFSEAGLSIFSQDDNYINFTVKKHNNKTLLNLSVKPRDQKLDIIKSIPLKYNENIILKILSKDNKYIYYYSLDDGNSFEVFTETAANLVLCKGYIGTNLGLYASSNGYKTKEYAEFEWVKNTIK